MNLAARDGRIPVRTGSVGSATDETPLTQREKDLLMKFVKLMQGRVGLAALGQKVRLSDFTHSVTRSTKSYLTFVLISGA